jgi:hypothetical protein
MNSKIRSAGIILCLFAIISLFNSCKKDDPDPYYVGTWAAEDSIVDGDQSIQVRDEMTFTKDSFTDMFQVYDETKSLYVDYLELKGALSVSGSIMSFTINELGISSFDPITGNPTGVITLYESGTSGFESIFGQISQPRNFSLDFSVSGNIMSIKSDNNGDGDYNDAGEITQYTKQ